MTSGIFKLKTLVMMQIRDKMEMSFTRSKLSLLFKIAAIIGRVALSGVAFFEFFFLTSELNLFSFAGLIQKQFYQQHV